jgi:c-di-GMP-binding flagellar brake protein YcgR
MDTSVCTLDQRESQQLLKTAINQKVTAILSYSSKNKWHVAKVYMLNVDDNMLRIESMHPETRRRPLNIQVEQPVGVSFKYSYGKFIFDSTVLALEPSGDPNKGGRITVSNPEYLEVIQRRSYFRVSVPKSMHVNIALWHRAGKSLDDPLSHEYCAGQLMDISAGGLMLALSKNAGPNENHAQAWDSFRMGQFIGLRFTPLPYETPLTFNAQIRNILPTADNQAVCLGVQMIGLEASSEGRQTIGRIASIVEKYQQINEQGAVPEMSHSSP